METGQCVIAQPGCDPTLAFCLPSSLPCGSRPILQPPPAPCWAYFGQFPTQINVFHHSLQCHGSEHLTTLRHLQAPSARGAGGSVLPGLLLAAGTPFALPKSYLWARRMFYYQESVLLLLSRAHVKRCRCSVLPGPAIVLPSAAPAYFLGR